MIHSPKLRCREKIHLKRRFHLPTINFQGSMQNFVCLKTFCWRNQNSVFHNSIMNMISWHVFLISWGDHIQAPSPPLCSKPTCRIVAALSILIETRIFFSQSLEGNRRWRWMSFWTARWQVCLLNGAHGLVTFLLAHPEPVITGGTCGPYKWPHKWVTGVISPLSVELVFAPRIAPFRNKHRKYAEHSVDSLDSSESHVNGLFFTPSFLHFGCPRKSGSMVRINGL